MERYINTSRRSGIESYEIGIDFIKIKFKNNAKVYVYTLKTIGEYHLIEMKKLAIDGEGLNTYIMNHMEVRTRYERNN